MAATVDVDAAVDGDDAAGSWPPASGLSTAQTAATTAPVERPTKQLVLVPLPSAAQACLLKISRARGNESLFTSAFAALNLKTRGVAVF